MILSTSVKFMSSKFSETLGETYYSFTKNLATIVNIIENVKKNAHYATASAKLNHSCSCLTNCDYFYQLPFPSN